MKTDIMLLNAVIVELNFSCWSAKKHDRKASKDVTDNNGANSSDAAKVQKNLMAGMGNLKKVTDFIATTRNEFYGMTLPWSDGGQRMLPMAGFFDMKQWLDDKETEFNSLVQQFLIDYPLIIGAQAFQLGALFDRSEYPTVDDVKHKFKFSVGFLPLPTSGDFRVDAPAEALKEMRGDYEKAMGERVRGINKHLWDLLHDCLTKMSERLGTDAEGKKKVFRDTLVDNAVDLCDTLKTLNVTNDSKLEDKRRLLEKALTGVDPNLLRESDGARIEVKKQVDSVLSSWI